MTGRISIIMINDSKINQFAKLIKSLQSVINSDPYLNGTQKAMLSQYVDAVNGRVQAGKVKGIEMSLCMIRNSMLEWRKEALFA